MICNVFMLPREKVISSLQEINKLKSEIPEIKIPFELFELVSTTKFLIFNNHVILIIGCVSVSKKRYQSRLIFYQYACIGFGIDL